jgi:hypothetical protein
MDVTAVGSAATEPAMNAILPTENKAWGFWGTTGAHAVETWPSALAAIQQATRTEPETVRAFLDSRHGRHFADDVLDAIAGGATVESAIAVATTRWMTWRISHRTSCETGIPAGLPYLTGFVLDAESKADRLRSRCSIWRPRATTSPRRFSG